MREWRNWLDHSASLIEDGDNVIESWNVEMRIFHDVPINIIMWFVSLSIKCDREERIVVSLWYISTYQCAVIYQYSTYQYAHNCDTHTLGAVHTMYVRIVVRTFYARTYFMYAQIMHGHFHLRTDIHQEHRSKVLYVCASICSNHVLHMFNVHVHCGVVNNILCLMYMYINSKSYCVPCPECGNRLIYVIVRSIYTADIMKAVLFAMLM